MALEAWFGRLEADWEGGFSESILRYARSLYRDGEVRAVELTLENAIIHGNRKQKDLYSLVEWSDGKMAVRSSTRDRAMGYALAAAGIYEIEELIADEIGAVPMDPDARELEKPCGFLGPVTEAETPDTRPDRPLVLRFSTCPQGLVYFASWAPRDCDRSEPVFLNGGDFSEKLTPGEREAIIRLTTMARRCGFENRARDGRYLLKDPQRLAAFGRVDLPLWRERFQVETDDSVDILSEGVRTVEVELRADSREDHMAWQWNFKLGAESLPDGCLRNLLRNPSQTVFDESFGLLRINRDQTDLVESCHAILQDSPGGKLPHYMVFSLFGQSQIKLKLSAGLARWRKTLLKGPSSTDKGALEVLRPYQLRGVEWMKHLCEHGCHCLLADEMGLGKTLQVIALIATRPIPGRSHLIVCPASVVPVWESEIAKFFPSLRVEKLKSDHLFGEVAEPAIWLTSYSQLRRQKHLLDATRFGYVVLDEGQQIKNPDAKSTLACMSIKSDHRLVLTGTPLENRQLDLWTLFRFLLPGLLGNRRRFTEAAEKGGPEFPRMLKQQIAPFVLRRTKKKVMSELPEKVEMELMCPMSELQLREYDRLTREGVASLGEDMDRNVGPRALSFFNLLMRLRQVCCDPGLLPWSRAGIEQSGKIGTLLDRVEEALQSGHKVVVFSQFVALLKRVKTGLERRLGELTIFELTGKTVDRSRPVAEFQNCPETAVILVSLRAGGTGITLHAADYVFLLDPWWNPAVEAQAVDRVHRIGQDKPVFVYRMITRGTIEERMEALKASKLEVFDSVVGGLADVSRFKNHYRSLSELIALTDHPQDRPTD